MVNGKSAIQWVMERQGVKTDKASGIVNDANNYAIETMQNPAYPLELAAAHHYCVHRNHEGGSGIAAAACLKCGFG